MGSGDGRSMAVLRHEDLGEAFAGPRRELRSRHSAACRKGQLVLASRPIEIARVLLGVKPFSAFAAPRLLADAGTQQAGRSLGETAQNQRRMGGPRAASLN